MVLVGFIAVAASVAVGRSASALASSMVDEGKTKPPSEAKGKEGRNEAEPVRETR